MYDRRTSMLKIGTSQPDDISMEAGAHSVYSYYAVKKNPTPNLYSQPIPQLQWSATVVILTTERVCIFKIYEK